MRLQGSRAPLCSTISESVLPLPASLSDPAPLHLRLQLARLAAPSFHRMGSTWSVARHARHSRETCCPPRSQWPECPHPVHGTRPLATGALITRAGRESVRPAPARYRNSAAMVLVARSYAYARALYHLIDIEPAVDRRQHAAEPRQIAEIHGSNRMSVDHPCLGSGAMASRMDCGAKADGASTVNAMPVTSAGSYPRVPPAMVVRPGTCSVQVSQMKPQNSAEGSIGA